MNPRPSDERDDAWQAKLTDSVMRLPSRVASVLILIFVAACGGDAVSPCCATGEPALRVINAFTTPLDVMIDGNVAIAGLAAGAIDTAAAPPGSHTLVLRQTGSGPSASQAIATTAGALATVAAVRDLSGNVSGVVLDDTNSVVPSGATKVRVLHLAPNAGTLQVYRTQPDYQQPVSWQFPFTYQSNPTSLSAPFYQSTVGSWEVRVWQTPADASGWAGAPVKIVIPLASGQKKTVLILDKPGGGVRVELM
jgi:hypothetical protein